MKKKILTLIALSPYIVLILIVFSLRQCNDLNNQTYQLKPTQTYQCSFHDKPLVLVSWRGKMSIRRYKMKDLERGTIIPGIRHYARKCNALPLLWAEGAKEKINELEKGSTKYSWIILGLILLLLVSINCGAYASESLDEIEYEENRVKEIEKAQLQIEKAQLQAEKKRQERLEVERLENEKRQKMIQHSERVKKEREERKRKKREILEANRLKNIERKKRNQQ